MMNMTLNWVARQLLRRPVRRPPRRQPKISGTTAEIAQWLACQAPAAWWTEGEIIAGVEREHGVVSWSLWRLRRLQLVEARGDARHGRYLLYRWADHGRRT